MQEHGTPSIPGWYIVFQQAVLAALPRPPLLSQDVALGWADNREALAREFAFLTGERPRPVYPANGEIFGLTLNADDPANDPLEMVRRDGYEKPESWRHAGTKLTGAITRRFKLVAIGYCPSFEEIKKRLKEQGRIPEGQWREPLKAKYREDGKGPVGIADASWTYPPSDAYFPYVLGDGSSGFRWIGFGFRDACRWLVEVSE